VLVTSGIVLVFAVAWIFFGKAAIKESGPKITYAITRGDLVVSVTEDGTLESSSNKEIKCRVKSGSTVLWVVESGTEVKVGDELVRLDTSTIEDNINQQKITYQTALATYVQSQSDVALAKIGITEYLEGTFRSDLKTAKSNVAVAEENLRVAKNILEHTRKMFHKGYSTALELDGDRYSVEHAKLELDVVKTLVEVLEKFTKPKMLLELQSTLKTAQAKLASDKASLDLEEARLNREKEQLANCVITADTSGMVIYPSAAAWKESPDIEQGATVREDQVLLVIPDLRQMQVKVGIHESKVDRLKPGMPAQITFQDNSIDGEVLSVASVTRPSGWWTENVVKYDTIIKLNSGADLKPGMSAAVEVFLARHKDVLTIPVAAVVENDAEFHCWVKTDDSTLRRKLELGDSNDQFIVVKSGLKEGDRVVLNPLAYIEEAQLHALELDNKTKIKKPEQALGSTDKKTTNNAGETSTPKTKSTIQKSEGKSDSAGKKKRVPGNSPRTLGFWFNHPRTQAKAPSEVAHLET